MKRFILYSLSATVAVTFGAVARADMYEETMQMDESPTEGVISPDSDSPNNRAIPGTGVDAEGSTNVETENLTQGIIVPSSTSPNNRAMPDRGALSYGDANEVNSAPTEGIIVPDSDEPSNRAIPSDGVDRSNAENAYPEVYNDYRETTTNEVSGSAEATDLAPTEGVISPDDDSPYNRATPQEGAIESNGMTTDSATPDPTDSIIVPSSTEPSNRVEVEGDDITDSAAPNMDGVEPTESIIVPDSNEPDNRAQPSPSRY